ncbi:MAG: N-acetylmuramoyl-L-alanine amidase [Planctomycetota bacterium]
MRLDLATAFLLIAFTLGCAETPREDLEPAVTPSAPAGRIIVAGEEVPIDARVVTWRDAGGYDGSCETCWFDRSRVAPRRPAEGCEGPRRYGVRHRRGLSEATAARIEAGGWDRAALHERVHQFVMHFDASVSSHRCFEILHDVRGLSVHFLLDVDGTIYQTLDLVHRARHAGWANDASIGIEIAHPGAYAAEGEDWKRFHEEDELGPYLVAPPNFALPPGRWRPARPGVFTAVTNGRRVAMYDYTEAQYRALERLAAWAVREFPALLPRVPDSADVIPRAELEDWAGFLGHHHISKVKVDPGPAFDWARVLPAAR